METEPYAKNSVLTKLLGDRPKVRLLTALLSEPDPKYDYNITELADLAGISRNTVYRHLPELEELGVVTETRTSGASQRYKLNDSHPTVEHLKKLEWKLARSLYSD
jgi:DNA-binding transcriptional ArsR family regulator